MPDEPFQAWDKRLARRLVAGFGLVSAATLAQAVGALVGFSRVALLMLVVPMLLGGWVGFTAYKAAGEPQGTLFAVGRRAATAAGLSARVWDVLVIATLIAAILRVAALVI